MAAEPTRDAESVVLTEATLRAAFERVIHESPKSPRLVLHPDQYRQAEAQGFIEGGVIQWERIAAALLNDGKEEAGSRFDAQSLEGGRRGEPASGELLPIALPAQDDRSEGQAVEGQTAQRDGSDDA